MVNKKNKIALVAIAKNESPYLPEWLVHHSYFGFDNVFIGINRTTDNSEMMLSKISQSFKKIELQVVNLDFIDKAFENQCPTLQFQHLAYSHLANIVEVDGSFDYVMFLDIDEFWFPWKFDCSISDYLDRYSPFDVMSFNWLYQEGEEREFTPPFQFREVYPGSREISITNSVKSLVSVKSFEKVSQFRAHCPRLSSDYIHIDQFGNKFCSDDDGSQEPLNDFIFNEKGAYVLHRIKRSPKEFLATLVESKFHEKAPLKINPNSRHRDSYKAISNLPILQIPDSPEYTRYFDYVSDTIESFKINQLVYSARSARIEACSQFIPDDIGLLEKSYKVYLTKSYGTVLFDDLISKICNESIDPIFLRDAAYFTQSLCLESSFKILKKAYLLKRDGKHIRKNLILMHKKIVGN